MNKNVAEILEFVKEKWDEAEDAGHWESANAFKLIQEYIESHRSELTTDEIDQMKKNIINAPVIRRDVNADGDISDE